MKIVADTSGIVSAMDVAEAKHEQFRQIINTAQTVVITDLVIAETHYVLSSSGEHRAAASFLQQVRDGAYVLFHPSLADYGQASELIVQYAGRMEHKRRKPGSLDLADAMNVVAAAKMDTHLLLSADQDYRVVRPLSVHPAFVILPWDKIG